MRGLEVMGMGRISSGLLVVGGVLFVACGGSGEADPKVGPPATSSQTTAAPSATPSTEPTTTATVASKPEAPKVVYDIDGPDGVRRMAKWDGPEDGEVITAKKAWVVAPNMQVAGSNKLSFETPTLMLADVIKADAKEVVFEVNKNRYAVPAALARTGSTKGLKKGMAARCSFGGSSVVGRLDAVDQKSATCAVRFLEKTEKVKLTAEEILPVAGDTLGFGAPIVALSEGASATPHDGWVVAESATDVWVTVERQFPDEARRVNGVVYKLPKSAVRPIDAAKTLKVGDACLARQVASMAPCKVTKVIDGGVAYVVSFDDNFGSPWKEWTMDLVAPGPKTAPAKSPTK